MTFKLVPSPVNAASVFTIDRPCVCKEPCEAILTGFNGTEQQVQERALYSLPVFASAHNGPSVKMEIMVQGFQLPGLKHSILSETVLCKENNYVRGDILFDCPCLVRTADWHVIRLFEIDNTFWMIVGDLDPSTFLPEDTQEKSRAMWSKIDMNKWQNVKYNTKLHVLRKKHNPSL